MNSANPSTAAGSFDVAIVGAGPTGTALANLLGRHGLAVAVIDRNDGILQIPRAVHIDGETMRAFQQMQLHRQMLQVFRPGHSMHWVDSRGETLLVRTGLEGLGPQGWHNDYYFHQPALEQVLRDGLARYASVRLIERTEVTGRSEDADGVTLSLHDQRDGSRRELRCRYLVGCDGARSIVRSWLGDEHEDLGEHQAWLVVDAVLEHPLPLPEHTVQHCDPARPATSIYVHPLRRRWEIMLLPGDDPQTITEPANVWRLLERWIRPGQGELERAATYVFHSLVARHWQRGRVMIAGDAAHQTPPFLGQGLCAGVRDAVNLAWKLAHALHTPASAAALLSTYGPERTPHAREFIALAVEVGRIIQVTDQAEAADRDQRLKAQGLKFAFPTPTLGPGMHRGSHPACGKVFLQPQLPDGRWLDDVAEQRFCVLLAERADAPAPASIAAPHLVAVPDAGSAARAWLAEQGALAVILRPDGYVFDVCLDTQSLQASLAALHGWLAGASGSR